MDETLKYILLELVGLLSPLLIVWGLYKQTKDWVKRKREKERQVAMNVSEGIRDEAGLLKREGIKSTVGVRLSDDTQRSLVRRPTPLLVALEMPGWAFLFIFVLMAIIPIPIVIQYLSGELPLNSIENVKSFLAAFIIIVCFPAVLPSLQNGSLYFYTDRLEVEPIIWRYRRVYPYESMRVIYKKCRWIVHCCDREPVWWKEPVAWYKFLCI